MFRLILCLITTQSYTLDYTHTSLPLLCQHQCCDTLSIWLINLQGGNYQHQGKFSDDINTSSKTILQEYLYWNDRLPFCVIGTCSPVRICLHFCVAYLHLMVGARL